MTQSQVAEPPDPLAELDITVDIVRVLVASPRDWGQGKTAEAAAQVKWMEHLLDGIRELWPWATILHDGCPTGGTGIIERYWAGALGLPTEAYRPEWETCSTTSSSCEPDHRKPRRKSDTAHGTADDYCPSADLRMVTRILHPDSTVRPHRVIGVCTEFSRVTRETLAIARRAGLLAKPYRPKWHGDEFRSA